MKSLRKQHEVFDMGQKEFSEDNEYTTELQTKEISTPQDILPKQMKMNTQKIIFQNFMNEEK